MKGKHVVSFLPGEAESVDDQNGIPSMFLVTMTIVLIFALYTLALHV